MVSTILPTLPGLAHVPERLRRPADVPARGAAAGPAPRCEQRRAVVGQHLPHPRPARPSHGRTPGSRPRDGPRRTSPASRTSALPSSTNRPPRRQQPQRGVDELPGQGVQHHVDPAAAGRGRKPPRIQRRATRRVRRRPGPARAARPTWPGSPSRTPPAPGAGRAGPRPCPTPPAAGVHQHRLARRAARPGRPARSQAVRKATGTAAACGERPARRDRHSGRASVTATGPNAPANTPMHPVAGRQAGHPGRRSRAPRRRPRGPARPAPGYMPRAISTSRKFSPAARTRDPDLDRPERCRARPGPGSSARPVQRARRRGVQPPGRSAGRHGQQRRAGGRAQPGHQRPPARTATCGSPAASAAAHRAAHRRQSGRRRSTSSSRPGFSAWAPTARRPHSRRPARSDDRSAGRGATAPLSSATRRAPAPNRSSASHCLEHRGQRDRPGAHPVGDLRVRPRADSAAPAPAPAGPRHREPAPPPRTAAASPARSAKRPLRRTPDLRPGRPPGPARPADHRLGCGGSAPAAPSPRRTGSLGRPHAAAGSGRAAPAGSSSEPTEATAAPAASARVTETPSVGAGDAGPAAAAAPAACSDTPVQANGSCPAVVAAGRPARGRPRAGRRRAAPGARRTPAAPAASAGRATSAKTSPPRRQAPPPAQPAERRPVPADRRRPGRS